MDDPRPAGRISDIAQIRTVMDQGIGQCLAIMAGGGMDDHARWFVQNKAFFIFKEDSEGSRFRYERPIGCRRIFKSGSQTADMAARHCFIGGFAYPAVDPDEPLTDQAADGISG